MYTVEEIRQKIVPIAKEHRLKAVWLFGSYARGDATEESDIDLLYDRTGSDIRSITQECSLWLDLKELFGIEVDFVSLTALKQKDYQKTMDIFVRNVERDKVILYEESERT